MNEQEKNAATEFDSDSGFSERFDDALRYAASIHRLQKRKTSPGPAGSRPIIGVPYIGHLLGVASIVIDAGGSEDEAIGALLHDAAEDQGGRPRLGDIERKFGRDVRDIVDGCSDSLTTNPEEKAPWRERKERYIAHLSASTEKSVYLVSAADKCHNARATARDLFFATDPSEVVAKFNLDAGASGILWYYRSLIAAYRDGPPDPRRDLIVSDLSKAVDQMSGLLE